MPSVPGRGNRAARQRGPRSPLSTAVVALGGGHGLSVTLRALRRLTTEVTAVVGVADDGGSSGRLRDELNVPPPGDLRMALAALCGDDVWGQTWAAVMQHRFGGDGEISGHATGNLLIAALWEETGSVVAGLDWVGALLGVHGRVLPVAERPLEIVAEVLGADPADPAAIKTVRGQVELEHSRGTVVSVGLNPPNAAACSETVTALCEADNIFLGPGSFYTSVLPHLMVPGVRVALAEAHASRTLILNLDGKHLEDLTSATRSTQDFSSARYLEVWRQQCPEVSLDTVVADPRFVDDVDSLAAACAELDANLLLERVATNRSVLGQETPRHDAHLLAAALATVLGRGNI